MQYTGQVTDYVATAKKVGALRANAKAAVGARVIDKLAAQRLRQIGRVAIIVIVQNHATTRQIIAMCAQPSHARRCCVGELKGPSALIQNDLPVTCELEVFRHREGVAKRHAHALARFVKRVDIAHDGQCDERRRDLGKIVPCIGDDHRTHAARRDFGEAIELGHRTRYADALAFDHWRWAGVAEHKDAFRSVRIGVRIRVFFLQKKSFQLRRALKHADDHALHRYRLPHQRRRRATALHVVNLVQVVIEDRALTLSVGEDRISDVSDVDEERFV